SPLTAPADARTVASAAGLPELSHRLTSLDLGSALDAVDQIAGTTAAPTAFPVATALPGGPRHELVLIDFDVPDRDELTRDLLATPGGSVEVVELNGGGVAEVTATLRQRRGLDAVHLVSHAAPGGLHLGTDWL